MAVTAKADDVFRWLLQAGYRQDPWEACLQTLRGIVRRPAVGDIDESIARIDKQTVGLCHRYVCLGASTVSASVAELLPVSGSVTTPKYSTYGGGPVAAGSMSRLRVVTEDPAASKALRSRGRCPAPPG